MPIQTSDTIWLQSFHCRQIPKSLCCTQAFPFERRSLKCYTCLAFENYSPINNLNFKQESSPVRYIPPTCANCTCFYSHQMSTPVGRKGSSRRARGVEGNKFEPVSSDVTRCRQMLLAGVLVQWGPMSRGAGARGSLSLGSHVLREWGQGWGQRGRGGSCPVRLHVWREPVQWGPMHHR